MAINLLIDKDDHSANLSTTCEQVIFHNSLIEDVTPEPTVFASPEYFIGTSPEQQMPLW
jgi:hypothetical protein